MSNTGEGKPAGKSGQRSRKGERGKKTVSKKGPPESPAPVQLQSPDQDQPLQPQPVQAESPKVDEPPTIDEPVDAVATSPEPAGRSTRQLSRRRARPSRPPADCGRLSRTASRTRTGRACKGRTRTGRTCTGELADHRERLSRLHQEIIRGFRVVRRAAQRRSVARQGDVCSHRICEAGLRDLRCRVAEDLRTPQQACPANPRAPSRFGRQGAGNARQVLSLARACLGVVARKQEAPVFRSFLRYLGMVEIDHSAPYAKRSMSSLLLPTISCLQKLAARCDNLANQGLFG